MVSDSRIMGGDIKAEPRRVNAAAHRLRAAPNRMCGQILQNLLPLGHGIVRHLIRSA
jgi:hypothetical protein